MTEKHTPTMLPLIVEFNDKSGQFTFLGHRPDGNNRSSDGRGTIFYIDATYREDVDVVAFPRIDGDIAAFADFVLKAVNSHTALVAALRDTPCPRPCNGRPDEFLVGQCVDARECGCSTGAALSAEGEKDAPSPEKMEALYEVMKAGEVKP